MNDLSYIVLFFLVDDIFTAITSGVYEYKYVWIETEKNSITFSVAACQEAYIALAKVPDSSAAYEVALGIYNKKECALRATVKGADIVKAITDNIIVCGYARDIWISWEDFGEIKVGKGTKVGSDVILQWPNPIPRRAINTIGFATGDGVFGTWRFNRDMGKLL